MTFLAALLAQGLALVWLTWPLSASLATHRPYLPQPFTDFDAPLVAWALAHESHALVTDPASFAHGTAFFPSPHALYYGEPAFGALPFFAPAFLATGNPTLALNVTFLLGVALTAASVHYVVRRWTGSVLGGLFAGWSFLHVPWILATWVPSAPNYAILFPLPLLMWAAADPAPTRAKVGAMFALAILQALVSPYLAVAVCAPLGVLGAMRLVRPGQRYAGACVVGAGLAAIGATFLAYHGPMALHAADPDLRRRSLWFGAPIVPLFVPGGWFAPGEPTAAPAAALTVVAVGLAVRVLRRGSDVRSAGTAWRHAGLWTVSGVVASLPRLVVVGTILVPGTWALLDAILPTARGIRVPTRIGVVALMGLAVAAGAGWGEIASALRRAVRRLGAGARVGTAVVVATWLLAMGAVHGAPRGPFELTSVPDSRDDPVLQAVMRARGSVIEMPIAGPISHAGAMYRSIFHGRPLLNGYSGYWPLDFRRRMEIACRLPDPAAIRTLQADAGLEMIVVNREGWGRPNNRPPNGCKFGFRGQRRLAVWERAAVEGHPALQFVTQTPERLLFRVRSPHPPS